MGDTHHGRDRSVKDRAESVQDEAEDAASKPWVEKMGRMGFATRGVLFITIGLIAGSVGFATSESADTSGAIDQLSQNAFGTVILAVLVVGLLAYALLRLVHVVINPSGDDGLRGAAARIGYLSQGAVYGALSVQAVQQLLGGGGGGGGSEEQATSTVLELPGGRWLVGIAALVVAGIGVSQVVSAFRRDFMDAVESKGRRRQIVRWTGMVGHIARGVLFGTVAWLLAQAALQSDSSEAGGTDEAVRELALTPFGTVLLTVVAAGVVVYGIWCLAMARWADPREAG
jgi:hypothetical protein